MTPNILVIFNIDKEDDICEMFLPFWRTSGCDLLFSSPLDAPSKLDFVDHVYFGKKLTARGAEDYWYYQSRVLDTFKYCLTLEYEGFIFTQYDSICLGKLPVISTSDSIHHFAGANTQPFESKFCLHPPWCFGKERLEEFVKCASQESIHLERGVMDRWLPLIMQRHKLAFTTSDWSWSKNSIDTPEYVEDCRQAIARGILFVHGVKNRQQLNAIFGTKT